MRNVRIEVAYDGSRFHGWQRQDGFRSVQQTIEEAVLALCGDHVCVHGSGRTDTGVHALRQVASFHVEVGLDDDRLLHALNAHLAPGVVLRRLETCRDDFHAQFDARGKRYLYRVATGRFRPPFGLDHAHWVRDPLDLGAMRRAAAGLVGEHDFSAFANAGSPRKSNVRRLSGLRIVARREGLGFVLQGSGFLYNMARTIAGTLLHVGRGRMRAEEVGEVLAAGERERAGPTAPAAGLWLLRVLYDEPVLREAPRGPRGTAGAFPDLAAS